MKVFGRTIIPADRESLNMLVEMSMKESGRETERMGKVFTRAKTEEPTRVDG